MLRNNRRKNQTTTIKQEKDMRKKTAAPRANAETKNSQIERAKGRKTRKTTKERKPRKSFKEAFYDSREKVWAKKRARVKLHHSFRRSYREDYQRELAVPGLVAHATSTLKILFKNWKLFGLLLVFTVICNIIFVGLMDQATYDTVQDSLEESYEIVSEDGGVLGHLAKSGLLLVSTITTGGLTNGMSEVQQVFLIFFFAVTWLVTIYYLRHLMAGNKPKFRDGIFNALTPLMSSFVIVGLIFVHALPILFCTVVYSSAATTGFLDQPLYAFLFWLFCGLLGLLSLYLLPVSITALVAISVPGMYPMTAVHAATDLLQGRRTKFIIRIIFCVIFLAVIWVLVMIPLMWLDLVLKENFDIFAEVPFASICLQVMTVFTMIYLAAYVYLFYRRMLDDEH